MAVSWTLASRETSYNLYVKSSRAQAAPQVNSLNEEVTEAQKILIKTVGIRTLKQKNGL